jgi:hypothetical protein
MLDASAHWLGVPAAAMSKEDFRSALVYKLRELHICYSVMTVEQARQVAARMQDIPVPAMMGSTSEERTKS